jgi:hypothetical protein
MFAVAFSGTNIWIQDFVLAKQIFYCLRQTSSPFAKVILELFVQAGLQLWSSQSQFPN